MPAALMQPELAAARVSTYRSIITCPTRAEFKLVAVDQTLELNHPPTLHVLYISPTSISIIHMSLVNPYHLITQ